MAWRFVLYTENICTKGLQNLKNKTVDIIYPSSQIKSLQDFINIGSWNILLNTNVSFAV